LNPFFAGRALKIAPRAAKKKCPLNSLLFALQTGGKIACEIFQRAYKNAREAPLELLAKLLW